jgi:HEAT repeat protein
MGPEGDGVTRDVGHAPGAESLDPIFRGQETPERATKKATLLFQFFLFPLLIVVASVGVFLFFGAIGGTNKTTDEYIEEIRAGGAGAQQSTQQLATLLVDEYAKAKGAVLFADNPARRADLKRAFVESMREGYSSERRRYLVTILGAVGDPDYLDALAKALEHPGAPGEPADPELRRWIVLWTGRLRTDEVVPVLAPYAKDPDEAVANFAVKALSAHPTPAAVAALKVALAEGASPQVRDNAGLALAVLGDAAGLETVERYLDPAHVEKEVGRPAPAEFTESDKAKAADRAEALRADVLGEAIRGAYHLRADRLRPRVESLEKDRNQEVRQVATAALREWK